MKIIIGLGNPGIKYNKTRHNTGFVVLDMIKEYLIKNGFNFENFSFDKNSKSDISKGIINSEKIILVKPQTYMNDSGKTAYQLINFYKLDPKKDIIVIYDDIDLPLGRITTKGKSAAGHKGMQSIIDIMKTNQLKRIRIGILKQEKNKVQDTARYVLERFEEDEYIKIKKLFQKIFLILCQDFLKIKT